MADALLQTHTSRQRLLRERKDAVCGVYHPTEYSAERSGEYRYLPERCIKLGQGAAARPRRTRNTRQMQDEIVAERDRLARLVRAFPAGQQARVDQLEVPSSPTQVTAVMRRDTCYKFIMANMPRMMSMPAIRAQPDPAARINALMDEWSGGLLRRRGWATEADGTRRRMFQVLKDQYDAMLA